MSCLKTHSLIWRVSRCIQYAIFSSATIKFDQEVKAKKNDHEVIKILKIWHYYLFVNAKLKQSRTFFFLFLILTYYLFFNSNIKTFSLKLDPTSHIINFLGIICSSGFYYYLIRGHNPTKPNTLILKQVKYWITSITIKYDLT